MVLITPTPGGLGNQLLIYARFLALAEEYDLGLLNLSFGEQAWQFPSTRRRVVSGRLGPRGILGARATQLAAHKLSWRLFQRLPAELRLARVHRIRLDWNETFDVEDPGFIHNAHTKLVLFDGFWLKDRGSFRTHEAKLRRHFRPSALTLGQAENALRPLRERCDLIVGIHLRQDDYRNLMGGRFCYSTSIYRNVVDGVADFWPGKRVGFFLSSNLPQTADDFSPHICEVGHGDALTDLTSLALCDRLIAPPSTFSLWASFMGDTPLAILRNPSIPAPTDFVDFWQNEQYFFGEFFEEFSSSWQSS
jgi:hypothetical protein